MKTYNEKSAIERHGDISQPRVYLSGSITGFKREEYLDKFANVEKQFREKGWAVINPAAVCDELPEMEHDEYMYVALTLLGTANFIYVIDGEFTSKGVKMEIQNAQARKIIRISEIIPAEMRPHHCGGCSNFDNENIIGDGFCIVKQMLFHCSDEACDEFKN